MVSVPNFKLALQLNFQRLLRIIRNWGLQENFFKYMREEFALDALVGYDTEPDDATREVPNPVWRGRDAQLRKAKTEFEKQCAHAGIKTIPFT